MRTETNRNTYVIGVVYPEDNLPDAVSMKVDVARIYLRHLDLHFTKKCEIGNVLFPSPALVHWSATSIIRVYTSSAIRKVGENIAGQKIKSSILGKKDNLQSIVFGPTFEKKVNPLIEDLRILKVWQEL